MENIIQVIAAQTTNLMECIDIQTAFNKCTIEMFKKHTAQIASLKGQTTANTILIGLIAGYLIRTRKK